MQNLTKKYTHPVIFNHTQVYTTRLQRTIDILPKQYDASKKEKEKKEITKSNN